MKKSAKFLAVIMAVAVVFAGCGSMSNAGKGALYGGGGGAALGTAIGALAGGKDGALLGAAIGAGVGAGAGALIGNKMDKKQAEIAQAMKDAQVEQVTDQNGFQAIKVVLPNGILFGFNSSVLNTTSQSELTKFAQTVVNEQGMDISIYGNTDNVGTLEANQKVSLARAQAVQNFLLGHGVPASRVISVVGLAYNNPVASNDTEAGRAQNRRVELFLTANQHMVNQAQAGTLQ
jgi:outer membrane protein OmpA-like peptidoglycan-associated protein